MTTSQRVLNAFCDVSEAELEAPTVFWEENPCRLNFVCTASTSHLRQHTIQMEKILIQLGQGPNEARRLLRLGYAAMAEVEAACLGSSALGEAERQVLADEIKQRTAEIRTAVSG